MLTAQSNTTQCSELAVHCLLDSSLGATTSTMDSPMRIVDTILLSDTATLSCQDFQGLKHKQVGLKWSVD